MDYSKITYTVKLLRANGDKLDLTEIITDASVEENQGELAQRASLTLANIKYNKKRISSLAKPGCFLIFTAKVGGVSSEFARIKITEWAPSRSGTTDVLELSGYDILYDLQASQDNRYISKGVTTKAALESIFKAWGITVGAYKGPTFKNPKKTYKNKNVSDIALSLLRMAKKHGSADCFLRSNKTKVDVLPKGSNTQIYWFEEGSNIISSKYSIDTSNVVTVVKVMGYVEKTITTKKGKKKKKRTKKQKVEAVLKGNTKYGKRQQIYTRTGSDSLKKAKKAAQQILDDDGAPTTSITIQTPDVPTIRKWDVIHVKTRFYDGYALVKSISHNITNRTMSLTLKKHKL
ncbi:MAG: hypothetical protein ACI4HO_08715 [Ruminococcus sp.]